MPDHPAHSRPPRRPLGAELAASALTDNGATRSATGVPVRTAVRTPVTAATRGCELPALIEALRDVARTAGYDVAAHPAGIELLELQLAGSTYTLTVTVAPTHRARRRMIALEISCTCVLRLGTDLDAARQESIHSGINVMSRPLLFYVRQHEIRSSFIQFLDPAWLDAELLTDFVQLHDRVYGQVVPVLREAIGIR